MTPAIIAFGHTPLFPAAMLATWVACEADHLLGLALDIGSRDVDLTGNLLGEAELFAVHVPSEPAPKVGRSIR